MSKITPLQKILFLILCGLIILMIIFSVMSLKFQGEEGYNQCIENKCKTSGEAFCNKFREINNCCMGAGGIINIIDNKPICTFN